MKDKYILAIDDEREKATLTNRAGRLLFEYTERLNFEQNAVPEKLKGMSRRRTSRLTITNGHTKSGRYTRRRGRRFNIKVHTKKTIASTRKHPSGANQLLAMVKTWVVPIR